MATNRVVNLSGATIEPLAPAEAKATVLIFLGVECPISNRYAPELRRLHARFTERGVRWWHVYPGPAYSATAIREHQASYQLPDCAALDPNLALTHQTGARITPQAVVYAADGRLVYRGRIDDRHPDLSVVRPEPTQRDLERVLEQLLAAQPVTYTETRAVGCFSPGLP